MQLDLDLTAWLQWATYNQVPVEQNKVAEDYTSSPAIMFIRRNSQQEMLLDGTPGLYNTEYDVEIYGEDIDAVDALVEQVRVPLNGFQGQMGQSNILGAFVSDHTDDYTPKVDLSTDEGLNVQTFSLQIIHYP